MPGMFDDLVPQTAAPTSSGGMFDDLVPTTKSRVMGDVRAAVSGIDAGVAGIAGLPANLASWAQQGINYGQSRVQGRPLEEVQAENDARAVIPRSTLESWGSAAAHANSPLAYEPQTTEEKYIHSVGEFAPSVVAGPASLARKAAMAVIPGIATELAGQATEGTGWEAPARVGAAVLGGAASGIKVGAAAAKDALAKAVPKTLEPAQWDEAVSLVQRGATWDEALNQATGGGARQMSAAMRVAANSPKGGEIMDPFYAARARANIDEAGTVIGDIAPASGVDPIKTGIGAQKAAEGVVTDTSRAINAAEEPFYTAANMKSVPVQDLQFVSQDPAFQAALKNVRGDTIRNKDVANFAANDVPTLIAVRKELARMEGEAMNRGPGLNPDREMARNITPVRDRLDQIITTAAPEYGQALGVGAGMRETQLEPLKAGPIGDIAATTDVGAQTRAIFPDAPPAGFHQVAAQAVRRIAAKDPDAALGLAHSYLQTTFDQATSRLKSSGVDQNGPAGWAAAVFGNPEQRKGVEGVLKALPSGQQRWDAMNKILEVFEAQQYRPGMGSPTAFAGKLQKDLSKGSIVGEAATEGSRLGLTMAARLRTAAEDFRYGKNTAGLARILTDPASVGLLRELAKAPAGSTKAQGIVLRLSAMANQAATSRQPSP